MSSSMYSPVELVVAEEVKTSKSVMVTIAPDIGLLVAESVTVPEMVVRQPKGWNAPIERNNRRTAKRTYCFFIKKTPCLP